MKRATHSYQILLSAMLALSCANHGPGRNSDLAITPATLDFKYDAAIPSLRRKPYKSKAPARLKLHRFHHRALPYSAEWLSVSTLAGTTSASLNVYVNPTSLPGGSYTGSIVITSASAANPVHTIPITLEVGNALSTHITSPNAVLSTTLPLQRRLQRNLSRS